MTTDSLDTATPLTMALSETSNGQTIYYWQGLDTLAQSDGTATRYFGYDGLGSVRQLTDAAGTVQLAQTFDPYGNGYSKAGTATTSLRYTGEFSDASTGFVFLRARYYNPSAGRFLNADPSRQEENAYQYAMDDPVNYLDPSGLKFCGGTPMWSYVEQCPGDTIQNVYASAIKERLRAYAIGGLAKGYRLAPAFLFHYLDASGTNLWVDPARIPQQVKSYMSMYVNDAVQASPGFQKHLSMFACSSSARNFSIDATFDIPFSADFETNGRDDYAESGIGYSNDLYFAFGGGGFHYRSAGTIEGSLNSDSTGMSKLVMKIPVEIYDHYDWCYSGRICSAYDTHFYDQLKIGGIDIGQLHVGDFFLLENAGMAAQFHIFSGWILTIELSLLPTSGRIVFTHMDNSLPLPGGGPNYVSINPLQPEAKLGQ